MRYFEQRRSCRSSRFNGFVSAATVSGGRKRDASASAATSGTYALQAAAAAQGIDPALAYLDPSLAGSSTAPSAMTYTAKFNSRTGAFARPDGRDPTHLSEYERAKRMSEAYFDVGQWEQDVEARDLEEQNEGKKRKRPTKKDLVSTLSLSCSACDMRESSRRSLTVDTPPSRRDTRSRKGSRR